MCMYYAWQMTEWQTKDLKVIVWNSSLRCQILTIINDNSLFLNQKFEAITAHAHWLLITEVWHRYPTLRTILTETLPAVATVVHTIKKQTKLNVTRNTIEG